MKFMEAAMRYQLIPIHSGGHSAWKAIGGPTKPHV